MRGILGATFGTVAAGAVRQLVYGGKADYASIAADAFGNALGNAFVEQVAKSQQVETLIVAQEEAARTRGINLGGAAMQALISDENLREEVQYIANSPDTKINDSPATATGINLVGGTNDPYLLASLGSESVLLPDNGLALPANADAGHIARAQVTAKETAAYLKALILAIELGTATEADIRKAGLLLRDNFGYQIGLDKGSIEALRGDPSVWSAVDGNKRYGVEIAATAFLNTQGDDPTQNSERYQLFSMGQILRSDASGNISRVAVEFDSASSYLAESMNISAQEARAKIDWNTYKTMVDAAFSTVVGQGINATRVYSVQVSGVWRPLFSEFEAYFAGGNNGGAAQMTNVMAAAGIRPNWSTEHSNGKALDISRISGIAVNSSGQLTQEDTEIVKQFSYQLAVKGARKVLQPWMVRGVSPAPNTQQAELPNQNLSHDFMAPNQAWRNAIKHHDHLHFLVQ